MEDPNAGLTWRTWLPRPIAWFAIAYSLNIVLHEGAHAFTAFALGVPSTLFNFSVNTDGASASDGTRALIGIAGPVMSLIIGMVCFCLYRRKRESAGGLPLLYLATFGATIFFGNLMSAAFVGDFSTVASALDLPMAMRYSVSVIGAVAVAGILFLTGRELTRWTPAHLDRVARAASIIGLPVLVGTALVVLVNQPLSSAFVVARAGEASFWLFAFAGVLTVRMPRTVGTSLRFRRTDALVLVIAILIVRVMARGIALTP
jgi:hypothetical protein